LYVRYFNTTYKRSGALCEGLDIATCYEAEKLGWTVECGLDEICENIWRWQSQNSDEYSKHK